jgi:hypothetical protein
MVPAIDTASEPAQPRRLEKKTNMSLIPFVSLRRPASATPAASRTTETTFDHRIGCATQGRQTPSVSPVVSGAA